MSSKKTVLIFIDWFSPGFKAGGPVSSNINLIAHLNDEFNFKVVTRNTEYTEEIPYPDIQSDTWLPKDGYEGYYISKQQLNISTIRHIVKNTSYDLLYINGVYSWFFSLLPLLLAKKNKRKVIVSARGMLSAHSLGVKSLKKKLFVYLAKLFQLYKGVTFHATNNQEMTDLQLLFGNKLKVLIAPNLPRKMQSTYSTRIKHSDKLNIISVARISPEKNTLYALEILRAYSKTAGSGKTNIIFDLYGPVYNEAYWHDCKAVINSLPDNIKVNYKGSISPSELPGILTSAHFLFFPTRGENFGHTILESFQHGLPVIISNTTPWKNLEETQVKICKDLTQVSQNYFGKGVGWDIPLDKPEKFVEVIEYCASMEQDQYNKLSLQAYTFAEETTKNKSVVLANIKLFDLEKLNSR